MAEAFKELATDPVTLRPMLYPYKLFGRFYEISTLARLLEGHSPNCPFTRKPFVVADIEKPTLFERQFFDLVNNAGDATFLEKASAKHDFFLFCRAHGWNVEGAELGDVQCMVNAAMHFLENNQLCQAKRWAMRAAEKNNLFAHDILGHAAMLERDFVGAHHHFVKCWAAPSWNTKGRTAYFIAECYFERDMYSHALHWANRTIQLPSDPLEASEAFALCAQIHYLSNNFQKCIPMAGIAQHKNNLAAFLYAMCALRKVGKFKKDQTAEMKGSVIMRCLEGEGYILARRFLTELGSIDAVRNANRHSFRPLHYMFR